MRVRAGALQQVVLPREAQRLVVVRLFEQSCVVDLEHVDLRQVAVQRGGIGYGVAAVERVREEDEAPLGPDGGDRVLEGQATRDLLAQEEPDHLTLAFRLHLLAGDDDQAAITCQLDRLERAPEHVVVGDGDRAEADLLCRFEQLGRRDAAVVRPGRVRVEIDRDPLAIREWIGLDMDDAPPCGKPPVERVELGRDGGEVVAWIARAGRQQPLLERAARSHRVPGGTSPASLRIAARSSADGCVRTWTRPRRRSGTYGRAARARLPQDHDLPAVEPVETPDRGSGDVAFARDELDDDPPPLSSGAEELSVDSRRDHRVVAREALGCCFRGLLGRCE